MHIKKNVFNNIIGTILGLEGLEEQGVRKKLWFKPTGSKKEKVSKAPYTVTPNEKVEILELMKDVKYPYGYAGSLRNKINLDDKKFIGLKTHDCHVMLQRLLPVFIRPYLPLNVIEDGTTDEEEEEPWDISVTSHVIKPMGYIRRMQLQKDEIDVAHWSVMENCKEAFEYINKHETKYYKENPSGDNDSRVEDFHVYLLDKMIELRSRGSENYCKQLHILVSKPQCHSCYTHCLVNGLRFVISDKDQHMKTQNTGVMVLAGDVKYYGVLQNVIELKYAEGMPVIIFKCKWFNTDPLEGNIKTSHGIVSIDTTTTWYDDAPYCLEKHSQQVFYLHDPQLGDNWKVVNVVAQRGTYSDSCLSGDVRSNVVEQAYQEDETTNIPHFHMSNEYDEDDDIDKGLETPRTVPALHYDYDKKMKRMMMMTNLNM
ncbi:hypothetical protein QQ045_029690 [Rhodiola kirilowii]